MPWIVLCVVATAALVFCERVHSKAGRVVSKLTASAAFVGFGVSRFDPSAGGLFARALLVGLVCAALGDALLLASDHERHGPRFFLAGLAVFLLAHVAYAIAFCARGVSIFAVEGAVFPLIIAC